jgi:cyclase
LYSCVAPSVQYLGGRRDTVRLDHDQDGLYVLRGDAYDANATVLIGDGRAVLVDGMGSREDARALVAFVRGRVGLEVRFVIATHYFSDHMAALGSFPEASIVAHELYRHTFDAELHRTEEERGFFVKPTLLVRDGLVLDIGRFTLDIFHNPGHTMSTLGIEVPEADLLFAGDTVVGHLAYFAYSSPEIIEGALRRLKRRGRGRLLASHGGIVDPSALDRSLYYLRTLGEAVRDARGRAHPEEAIRRIPIEACLVPGLVATEFERLFHGRNLTSVVERDLYAH